MTAKERIHQLVDALPEDELETAERVLAGLTALSHLDPVTRAVAQAPADDEPVTEEEAEAIEEGEADLAVGRVLPSGQVRARLGL